MKLSFHIINDYDDILVATPVYGTKCVTLNAVGSV
jgi:hypothetical protein